MSRQSKVPFRVVRFKGFMVNLLRNRMAFAGLFILLAFSTFAILAPVLSPYRPQSPVVSAPLNPPSWVTFFYGETGFSRNVELAGIEVEPISGSLTTSSTSVDVDSATVTVSPGASGGTFHIVKSVDFPYTGSAKGFEGNFIVTPDFGGGSANVSASLFIDRFVAGEFQIRYELWDGTLSSPGDYTPFPSISATQPGLRTRLGIHDEPINAGQYIFSRVGEYVYGLEFSIPAGAPAITFTIKDFRLSVYGNVWGLLGTDAGGYDLYTQFAYGAQLSLVVGLVATFIGVTIGLIVGLLAGYLGKFVDEVMMRFTDMLLVIPGLPLLIVLAAVLGASLFNVILILGVLGWMGFARLVRSQVLSIRERPFIEAAKASGAGAGYVTVKHILPNVVSLTYVSLALSVPGAIVAEAALSFLGLSDVTVITWGRMLQLARAAGFSAENSFWWWIIPPGVAIAALSLSFILVGYALDEMFNPRLRKRR